MKESEKSRIATDKNNNVQKNKKNKKKQWENTNADKEMCYWFDNCIKSSENNISDVQLAQKWLRKTVKHLLIK